MERSQKLILFSLFLMVLLVFTSSVAASDLSIDDTVGSNDNSINNNVDLSAVDNNNNDNANNNGVTKKISSNISTNPNEKIITSSNVVNGNKSLKSSNNGSIIKSIRNPVLNITVRDAYNNKTGNYSEDGFLIEGAIIKIYNVSDGSLVLTGVTDKNGNYQLAELGYGTYNITISYSTYLPISWCFNMSMSERRHSWDKTFYPDIAFVVYYTGHSNKINYLMNLSRRVYYINNYNPFESDKLWLLEHANYIHLDMYSDEIFSKYSSYIINSPANKNYKIAYTFGTNVVGSATYFNFIGASPDNNTINTLENTYIGSYFQASEITNSEILAKNMKNLFDYIRFLLNETNVNPTLNSSRTPLLSPTWGIYHPDYGSVEFSPSQTEINTWINKNPGYGKDGQGSLNWMSEEYIAWQVDNTSPDELFGRFEMWYNANKKSITTPYIIVASYYAGGNLIDALIKSYESQGRAAFNLYQSEQTPSLSSLLVMFENFTSRGVSGVNSLYSWSLDYANSTNGGAIKDLQTLNVEVTRALAQISEESYNSEYGPQVEWTYSVTIPSFEGVFGTVEVSYTNSKGEEVVIQSGVDKLVQLSIGWAKLKEMNNSDKKIAIVLYNYPPGKSDIGASYLDIYNITMILLQLLADNGYDIGMSKDQIPDEETLTMLIEEACNKGSWAQGYLNDYVEKYWDTLQANGQLVSLTQYKKYLNSLNPSLRDELINHWGKGLGKIMVYNGTKYGNTKYIVIPGITFGNVFVTFQPSRGWEEEDIANYHNATLPAHQQYITFYKWLSEYYKANAIINMGTHGTLEFLPGRDIGLREDDWSFELNSVPTIYPYIVSNPGEAMIAKNRLGALLISHMTPATVISELYGNYTVLKEYIASYQNAIRVGSTQTAEQYKQLILQLSNSSAIGFGTPAKGQSFDDWLNSIESKLDDLENDLITYGLHTIGKVLTGEELIQEIITITTAKTNVYTDILHYLYPELSNLNFYDIKSNPDYKTQVNATKIWLYEFIASMIPNENNFDELISAMGISRDSDLFKDLSLANATLLAILNNEEWNGILSALSGGYVRPGLAGDPAYADVLPTGRSIYTGDTTKMPTQAAWSAAKNIVDATLINYYLKNNFTFPSLVAIIMWGTELLRTDGLAIAEFLYYLGVKPVWLPSGVVDGVELMDLSELKITLPGGLTIQRPRIDVFTSMVTSNVGWIKLLVDGLSLAALNTTDESFEYNKVKLHYNQTGSLDRLFGLPGNVLEGTGMSDYIPATSNWYDTNINMSSTLTNIYLNRVSYSWGIDSDGKLVIKKQTDAYTNLLKSVDLVTQNIDSTWRFLDSDDYYDWFGGLIGASNGVGGHAQTAVVDTRNPNNLIVRSASQELELEIRSTLLNPKYQEGLLNGASGWNAYAAKVQDLYAFATVSGDSSLVSQNTWSQLANGINQLGSRVNSASSAYGWESAAAWMIYAAKTGLWTPTSAADKATLQELVNNYVQKVVDYQAFACCHHTDPFSFNSDVASMFTGSNADLQKFNQLFKEMSATNQDLTSNQQQNTNTNSNQKVNGSSTTNNNQGQSSGSSQGSQGSAGQSQASVGQGGASAAVTGSAGSNANDGSEASSQASTESSSSQEAYELNEQSQPSSGSEASLPIEVMALIIALIVIFGYGFFRKNRINEEFEEY